MTLTLSDILLVFLGWFLSILTWIANEVLNEWRQKKREKTEIKKLLIGFKTRHYLHRGQLSKQKALRSPFRGEVMWYSEQLANTASSSIKIDSVKQKSILNFSIKLGEFYNWIGENIHENGKFEATPDTITEFNKKGDKLVKEADQLMEDL